MQDSIHDDADFYVTAQGVLGEQFLAIDPGSPEQARPRRGRDVKGIDPPRLDLFLAKAYELLDTTVNGIKNNRELFGDIATNTAGLLRGLNVLVSDNRERIDRIVANVEEIDSRGQDPHARRARQLRRQPEDRRTPSTTSSSSRRRFATTPGPMLKDAREALANVNRVSATVGDPQQQDKIRKAIGHDRGARRARERDRRRRAGHRDAHQEGRGHRRRLRDG